MVFGQGPFWSLNRHIRASPPITCSATLQAIDHLWIDQLINYLTSSQEGVRVLQRAAGKSNEVSAMCLNGIRNATQDLKVVGMGPLQQDANGWS